jgi:hypothetical protein
MRKWVSMRQRGGNGVKGIEGGDREEAFSLCGWDRVVGPCILAIN